MRDFYVLNAQISHSGTDAAIRKISDGVHIYILKQIHEPSLDEQFLLINDVIASTIGIDVGVKVNEVFFIPSIVGADLKIYPERAATLHTFISGKDLDQKLPNGLPQDFCIHQRCINKQSVWQQELPLLEHQQGLTQAIIESMSLHEDLSQIVALDTFIGNVDRSLPNIFYDDCTNHFCGIDQAAVFGKNLAQFANDRIKELLEEGYFKTCDSQIMYGLRVYQKMLIELVKINTPCMIIQSMRELLPYLGFNISINGDCSRMDHQAKIIKDAYNAILELILLLDQM